MMQVGVAVVSIALVERNPEFVGLIALKLEIEYSLIFAEACSKVNK